MATTADRITALVVEQTGVDDDDVAMNARFMEDLGCDSLDTVELVMSAEEVFGIEIPDEDMERLLRVSDAVAYIDKRLAEKAAT